MIGRERPRLLPRSRGVSIQPTRTRTRTWTRTWTWTWTWKESNDPDKDTKLDRIEEVTRRRPNRCLAFDQLGPLSIRPCHGVTWASEAHPVRLPSTYTRTHGIRYFHGCYSLGDDQLWGVTRQREGGENTLAALNIDPGCPPRRRPDLRHPRQPLREQDPHGPNLGGEEQRGAVLHPDPRSRDSGAKTPRPQSIGPPPEGGSHSTCTTRVSRPPVMPA